MSEKFLMINSPIYRDPQEEYDEVIPSIWLWYICTDLRKRWINVELLDAVAWKILVNEIISKIINWDYTHIWLNIFSTNLEIVKEIIFSINKKVNFIVWWAFTKTNYNYILKWDLSWNITVVVW